MGEIVHELVKGFKDSTIPVKTYSSMIWKRLAEQYPNVNSMRMWDAYLKYLKDMKLSLMYYPINKPIVA